MSCVIRGVLLYFTFPESSKRKQQQPKKKKKNQLWQYFFLTSYSFRDFVVANAFGYDYIMLSPLEKQSKN